MEPRLESGDSRQKHAGQKKKRPELDSKNKQVEIRIFFCFVAAIAQLSANVVKPGIVKWTVIQPHDGELSE